MFCGVSSHTCAYAIFLSSRLVRLGVGLFVLFLLCLALFFFLWVVFVTPSVRFVALKTTGGRRIEEEEKVLDRDQNGFQLAQSKQHDDVLSKLPCAFLVEHVA